MPPRQGDPFARYVAQFGVPGPPRAGVLRVEMAPAKPKNPKAAGAAEGKVVHLDRWFGKVKNRLNRVGFEMEGGWTVVPLGVHVENDGSVFDHGKALPAGCPALVAIGEIKSSPLEPISMAPWVKKYYPQVVDKSCGLHIHMSFKKAAHYSTLMDSPDYQETVLHYLKVWAGENNIPKEHCLWGRLEGENIYCRKLFWPDLQAVKKGKEHNVQQEGNTPGHRYTVVNYCWGMGFDTLEVRVIPMLPTAALSISALKLVMEVTNAYLAARGPRELAQRLAGRVEVKVGQEDGEERIRDLRRIHV